MATARPPGGGGSTPQARIGFDLSQLQSAPAIAREAGRATAREISNAFKSLHNEQRLAVAQTQQATAAIRAQSVVQQQAGRIAATQAQQALVITRNQQAQIAAAVRTSAQQQQQAARATTQVQIAQANAAAQAQIAQARAAAQIQVQQARVAAQAQIQANRAAAQSSGGLGGFARGVTGAALGSVGGPVGAFAGALASGPGGIAAGVGLAAVEIGRAAIEGERLATSYERQRVAALGLAGSQSQLNELLAAYEQATGGAVSRSQALADVTRLQAIGFANNAEELRRFVTVARGISLATGQGQDYVISQLQLAIANRSTLRLDQLGLGVSEVQKRIDELRASNKALTEDQVYQQAVLGLAEQKFGALTNSAIAQATSVERLAKAWGDLRLAMAQQAQGPTNQIAGGLTGFLNQLATGAQRKAEIEAIQTERNQQWRDELGITDLMARSAGVSPTVFKAQRLQGVSQPELLPSAANRMTPLATPAPGLDDPQVAALRRQREGFQEIERSEQQARLDATRQYESQRTSTIANYEKAIAREAEDFGRQRANAERKHALAILDVHQQSARQRVKWEEEMERSLQQARADSAERIAEWERDRDERIVEVRSDSAERVAEMEERYAKERERREADSAERILDAAGRLDAEAIYKEQRSAAKAAKEAEESHQEQLSKEAESLTKREAQENKSHQRRLDDEAKALEKSERQQRNAHQRRVEEQAENDRLRIEEMKASFEEQKTQEDIERGIRLQRQADDHAAQLSEMETQQGERLQQIKDHAQAERDQFTQESNAFLEALGIHNQKWLDEEERKNNEVIKLHEQLLAAERQRLLYGSPNMVGPRAEGWPRLVPESSIAPGAPPVAAYNPVPGWERSRNITVGDINVTIAGTTNMGPSELKATLRPIVLDILDEAAD